SAAPFELGDGLGDSNGAIFTPDGTRVLALHGNVLRSFALDGSGAFPVANTTSIGSNFSFTSDGEYLVSGLYFVSYVVHTELRSARVDGSAPSGHLLVDGIGEWELFNDNQRALVGTWNDGLRVVPLDGSPPVTLATAIPGRYVESLALSPDNSTAFFETHAAGSNSTLRRVPTDASSGPSLIGGVWTDIVKLEVTPDGTTLLVQTFGALWAVPTAGGTAVLLSNGVPNDYNRFTVLPDGARVVYAADRAFDGLPELYVQTIAGAPAPVRLDLATTGAVRQFQAAGDRVAYLGKLDIPTFNGIPPLRLFGVPDDASTSPAFLSDQLASGPPVLGDVTDFVTSSAGRVALFRADARKDECFELYAVSLTKSLPRKRLHPDLGTNVATEFALSADEQHAAFWSGSTLWCARTDGSTPAVALATASFTAAVSKLRFSRDGAYVLFRPGTQGFATVPADGSAPPTPLGPATLGVTWFEVDDSDHVVFRGNLGGGSQLYSAPVDGSAPATPLVTGGTGFEIQDVELHGAYAWFKADAVNNVFELVRVPIAGGSAEVMSAPMVAGGDVAAFAVAPSGTAVYLADGATDNRSELFRVLGPGSAALLAPMPANGDVKEFVLDASGTRVVFTADALVDERDDLFAVLADASAAPLLLAADASNDLRTPVLDPAGTTVAYGVGSGTTYTLRRVPVAGGASVALATFVREHRFTADSKQLVYWFDFSAVGEAIRALDLATGKTEILAEGPYDATNGQGQLSSFALARDGRVFVHGAAETKGVDELFLGVIGAPRTGGDAPGDGGTIVR
ncbi:MAG: hypothetical protein ABL998_19205, partial [Planctomycetota bacterium]